MITVIQISKYQNMRTATDVGREFNFSPYNTSCTKQYNDIINILILYLHAREQNRDFVH
jgi:hypothetical protein